MGVCCRGKVTKDQRRCVSLPPRQGRSERFLGIRTSIEAVGHRVHLRQSGYAERVWGSGELGIYG